MGWFFACVAAVGLAAASIPVTGWAFPPASAALHSGGAIDPMAPVVVRSGADALSSLRCPACGIVERIDGLQADGATPAAYEMTIRFRDGSRRTSSHADDARWHVGDSIMLMGGARLADRTQAARPRQPEL